MSDFDNLETGVCSNCQITLPLGKLDLHEPYCRRNMIRCQKCSEMIHKEEVSQHMDEAHRKINCPLCNAVFEETEIKKHEILCPNAPKNCQYCKLKVSNSEFTNHTYICGSRTRNCIICNKPFLLREIEFHEENCVLIPETLNKKEDVYPKNSIPVKQYQSRNIANKPNSSSAMEEEFPKPISTQKFLGEKPKEESKDYFKNSSTQSNQISSQGNRIKKENYYEPPPRSGPVGKDNLESNKNVGAAGIQTRSNGLKKENNAIQHKEAEPVYSTRYGAAKKDVKGSQPKFEPKISENAHMSKPEFNAVPSKQTRLGEDKLSLVNGKKKIHESNLKKEELKLADIQKKQVQNAIAVDIESFKFSTEKNNPSKNQGLYNRNSKLQKENEIRGKPGSEMIEEIKDTGKEHLPTKQKSKEFDYSKNAKPSKKLHKLADEEWGQKEPTNKKKPNFSNPDEEEDLMRAIEMSKNEFHDSRDCQLGSTMDDREFQKALLESLKHH